MHVLHLFVMWCICLEDWALTLRIVAFELNLLITMISKRFRYVLINWSNTSSCSWTVIADSQEICMMRECSVLVYMLAFSDVAPSHGGKCSSDSLWILNQRAAVKEHPHD